MLNAQTLEQQLRQLLLPTFIKRHIELACPFGERARPENSCHLSDKNRLFNGARFAFNNLEEQRIRNIPNCMSII
jgi:hypothetical protein